METILIIEDEENMLMGLEHDLTFEGYNVTGVKDGLTGLSLAKNERPDLIILDVMLPGIDGFDILNQMRDAGVNTPVLILTAMGREVDRILGLELGADDYVTKPFSRRELVARIKAILRRVKKAQHGGEAFRFGGIEVNFKKYEVRRRGKAVYLTSLEFALLRYFIRRVGEALTRDEMLDEIWGKEVFVSIRTIDTHVANLRKKLEDDPSNPKHIVGVRNVGYRFEP